MKEPRCTRLFHCPRPRGYRAIGPANRVRAEQSGVRVRSTVHSIECRSSGAIWSVRYPTQARDINGKVTFVVLVGSGSRPTAPSPQSEPGPPLFTITAKTGRKTVVLNAPAVAILNGLEKIGPYVVPGNNPEKPRPDLKRPWHAITKRAGLYGARLHDLRHTYASFGASGGLGLPILGRLLGHTQEATTARYAHLDNDPLRHASEAIGGRIAAALQGKGKGSMVSFRRSA
jgi:hypothetical protein